MASRFLPVAFVVVLSSCGPKHKPVLPPPEQGADRGTFDPASGCQQALDHLIELAVKATGSGPTDKQRSEFASKCIEAASGRASGCVMRLRRLPGRRGGKVRLGPALRCLGRR